MRKVTLAFALLGAIALAVAGIAAAAHYSFFGDGSTVAGGNPGKAGKLVSNVAGTGYAGVDVSPATPIAWSSLATLSTDYNVTDDNCGGGSPRFLLGVDTDNNGSTNGYLAVYIGPSPSYTGCATGWQSTGNLIGNNDAGRYDYSFGLGGSPSSTYSGAPAAVQNGKVTEAYIIVDSYWNAPASGGDNEQTVLVDNINLNGHVTTFDVGPPTDKDQCKKDGWKTFDFPRTFKNQGDCIQYVNTGK